MISSVVFYPTAHGWQFMSQKVEALIVKYSKLKGPHKAVLLAIARYAHDDGGGHTQRSNACTRKWLQQAHSSIR